MRIVATFVIDWVCVAGIVLARGVLDVCRVPCGTGSGLLLLLLVDRVDPALL